MAAVAVGMFVGAWLIGPAITARQQRRAARRRRRSGPASRTWFHGPTRRPIAPPTPAFDLNGSPHYAAAAKEKAQAELGGQPGDDECGGRAPRATPRSAQQLSAVSTGTEFIDLPAGRTASRGIGRLEIMGTLVLLDLMGGVALAAVGPAHGPQRHPARLRAGPAALLSHALGNRFAAFAAGLGLTALLQSSTATALMTASFTTEGMVALVPGAGDHARRQCRHHADRAGAVVQHRSARLRCCS